MRCDYADCTDPGEHSDQGWRFCATHYPEHRAIMYGEPWPRSRTVPVARRPRQAGPGTPRHAKWQQIEQLDAAGLSAKEIAVRLRVAQRTVERYRARAAA